MGNYHKPDDIDEQTWKQHLQWMQVMESSRRKANKPLKELMDSYFIAPGTGKESGDGNA